MGKENLKGLDEKILNIYYNFQFIDVVERKRVLGIPLWRTSLNTYVMSVGLVIDDGEGSERHLHFINRDFDVDGALYRDDKLKTYNGCRLDDIELRNVFANLSYLEFAQRHSHEGATRDYFFENIHNPLLFTKSRFNTLLKKHGVSLGFIINELTHTLKDCNVANLYTFNNANSHNTMTRFLNQIVDGVSCEIITHDIYNQYRDYLMGCINKSKTFRADWAYLGFAETNYDQFKIDISNTENNTKLGYRSLDKAKWISNLHAHLNEVDK